MRTRLFIVTMLSLMLMALAAAPVGAQPQQATGPANNPNAIAASDGVVPMNIANQAATVGFSPPATGTGIVTNNQPLLLPNLPSVEVKTGGAPESIIGVDTRFPIALTTEYPARTIALMTLTGGRCTAWMIGPDTAVTAGHCVFDAGRWSTNVRVYPGFTGTTAPFGGCVARRLYSVLGWTRDGNPNYDYGAVKLNCAIGNRVGWLGLRPQSTSLVDQTAFVQGYPGDKPLTQWASRDTVRLNTPYKMFYPNDTVGGQSGAPVYNRTLACNPCAIGIHTTGVGLFGVGLNSGTRIIPQVFNNLIAWRNAL
mgnify:CR=1 FL=1